MCARGDHRFRKVRPVPQLWITVPSYEEFDRVHRPLLRKLCPAHWYRREYTDSSHRFEIEWNQERHGEGSCEVWVLTYEMNPHTWTGAQVFGIWMDEPPPRPHMKEAMARLADSRGWLLSTFTPVDGIGWWYPAIWRPAREGKNEWFSHRAALAERDPATPADEFEVGRVLVDHMRVPFRGESEDPDGNPLICTCETIEVHGSCRACRDQVIRMARDYPDIADREIRVFGKVRGKQGLVYKQYDEGVHLVPRFELTPEYDIVGGLDPGYHGFHVTFGAISSDNRLYVVEEMFSQGETTQDRFNQIVEKVRGLCTGRRWLGLTITAVFFVDTEDKQLVLELNVEAAKLRDREGKRQDGAVRVHLAFASLDQGLKARKAGFLKVQQMLQPRSHRYTPAPLKRDPAKPDHPMFNRHRPEEGEPLIYFFDDLYCEWQGDDQFHRESRILWEILLYSWLEPVRGTTLKRDDADEHSCDGAHAMASLRYLVMSRYGTDEQDNDEPAPTDPEEYAAFNFHRHVNRRLAAAREAEEEDWIDRW